MRIVYILKNGVLTFILSVIALILISPIVIIFTNSMMTELEIGINYGLIGQMNESAVGRDGVFANLKLIPDKVSFAQYGKVFLDNPKYLMMFWNSVFMVVPIIVGQTLVAALAAYAFSKLKFRGRDSMFLVYVMTMLMPFQVTLVPNYIMVDMLGMLNTTSAIILPGIFAAFGVFMLRQFMLDIPYAYIEAAKMDGAGHLRIFVTMIVPMIKPGLAALVILLFVDYWNMVEQPLIFLDDPFKQPLSVFLSTINQSDKGIAFAASMLYMAPMVMVFLYAESYFIEGIQLSGVKG
ncbi:MULTISPECIES: carbohydrate ABC transporter permease [Paenibacillus]|uniref:carbohydrate ABC transporter permease n=1 Tax=Paenibacillus TaxID=44249 RepID=UPI000B82EF5F|nr:MULTISPECIES: carbohydrate ABC transporter permease [Paenibacillus]MBD8837080.1 carbohydrate ABC transporter permease [Paenibacillus sp. CFBP 13594]PRA07673.1 carbohydrate ABC transporter permease [Paenibacillus sp. MYb63]PRA51318.1 carbohydrate ABC transporter permease [Paenibacillus sp. MYb67]QZN74440.1 carbohydrate ABC transporter permease [Paenibacillus sp. DR312]